MLNITRRAYRLSGIAVVSVVFSVIAAQPVVATGPGGSDLLDDDLIHGTVTEEEGVPGGEDNPPNDDLLRELAPEGPPGPVGHVDLPTYEVVRTPGESIPSQVTVLVEDENVDLVTLRHGVDSSTASTIGVPAPTKGVPSLMALLVIHSSDAATEYRFENAVPDDQTATLLPDGSITLTDVNGEEAGYISAPWAYDSSGAEIPTSYRIEGSTLIQTVEHEGAVYPVVADPSWWDTVATFGGAVLAGVGYACLGGGCAPVVAPVAVSAGGVLALVGVANYIVEVSAGPNNSNVSNTCNMRNRSGC